MIQALMRSRETERRIKRGKTKNMNENRTLTAAHFQAYILLDFQAYILLDFLVSRHFSSKSLKKIKLSVSK